MPDNQNRIEIESAVESVLFATRHLDRAAIAAAEGGAGRTPLEYVAIARRHAAIALTALAGCLPTESEAPRAVDDAVPF